MRIVTLLEHYGYGFIAAAVATESMGIPVPGETILLSAAAYAGATHRLRIAMVILAAAAGAIGGDNLGFLIGRQFGSRLLRRYGPSLGITVSRIKLVRLLFLRHGGKVVFFGRFVAILRALAALLAGVNGMAWPRFALFEASGAVAWAGGYGMLAFLFGRQVERVARPIAVALLVMAVVGGVFFLRFIRTHEAALEAEADRAFPDS